MGKFQVKDKEGNDISGSFTPILKSLLLLILLHSQKDERGITNKKIDETLWGDKSEKSAQNNRNVSLSKLRSLLEKIGNIRIVQNNNFWKIESDNPAYCDYQMAFQNTFKKLLTVSTKKNLFSMIYSNYYFTGHDFLIPNLTG